MIYLVVPTRRPEMAERIRQNSRRQRTKHQLVTLPGPSSASSKRNMAASLLHVPGAFLAFVDDDDWLGPDYLTEASAMTPVGSVSGKPTGHVLWEDVGELHTHHGRGPLLAGTIAGYADDLVRCSWPEAQCEERGLLESAKAAGLGVVSRGVAEFVWCRRKGGHSWPADQKTFARCHGRPVSSEHVSGYHALASVSDLLLRDSIGARAVLPRHQSTERLGALQSL